MQALGVGQFDEDVGVAGFGQLAGTRQILPPQLARIEFLFADEIPVENESAGLPAPCFHGGGNVRLTTYEGVDVLFFEGQLPLRAWTDVDDIWVDSRLLLPPSAARPVKRRTTAIH